MTWKDKLIRYAKLNSMCVENLDALKACETKSDAIKLYLKTIDWALKRNYPGMDMVRSEFADSQELGIFVDYVFKGEGLNDHQVYVFHNCKGTIRVGLNIDKAIIPMLYFANGCEMKVEGINAMRVMPDIVPCYVFGDNSITAENDINAIFRIYREEVKHGG